MDIVVTRSSSSIFEFQALDLPMIMVPLPESGNNHQYWNAKSFEQYGHVLIEQHELAPKLVHALDSFKEKNTPTSEQKNIFDIYPEIYKKIFE